MQNQAMQASDKHGGAESGVYQPQAQGFDNLGLGANPAFPQQVQQ